MDAAQKMEIIKRPPAKEVIGEDGLAEMLGAGGRPKHYVGLEISGFLHLGSLLSTGYKVNDFAEAGADCTVFLADWHTAINDKLGGNMEDIARVSQYYEAGFRAVCPEARIRRGSELYAEHPEYWQELVRLAGHMSLSRTMRTLTITGRSEGQDKVRLGRLLYPAMQATDIRFLDVDIAHAGMDQRKIHVLVRELFPKLGWKVPAAVHHSLLPGLQGPGPDGRAGKMSKSAPNTGIFIHDSQDEIRAKIKKAWCEAGVTEENPLLEIAKQIIFRNEPEITAERPAKFGGNITYGSYAELESAFAKKELHPSDLKEAVARHLIPIVHDVAKKVPLDEEVERIIRASS